MARGAKPKIWVLADDRPGSMTQAVGLADALGLPYTLKQLAFSPLAGLHNAILGASRIGLARGAARSLAPPWPDLVIACGRRTAPPARWIGRASAGRARLVLMGRKGGHAADLFDLVVTPSHCSLPPHARRIETVVSLTRANAARLDAATRRWPEIYGDTASPRVLLLLGGTTLRQRLDRASAGRLGQEVAAFARGRNGSVVALTSRRTGAAAAAAVAEGMGSAGRVEHWRSGQDNPYLAYLAQADIVVVTGDSESMISEAVVTGKPVAIYPLPERAAGSWLGLGARIGARARAVAKDPHSASFFDRLCARLVTGGVVRPPRDLAGMYRRLVADGAAVMFGAKMSKGRCVGRGDLEKVVRRVRALLRAAPRAAKSG